MEPGKTDCTAEARKHRCRKADKQTKMARKYKKKENRLQPCSSIWPGQIRWQHPGIYQAPPHRCITWMARQSGSHFLIVCGLCASLSSCLYHSVVYLCATALHPRGETQAHLAEAAWPILEDSSGVQQINKQLNTGLDLDRHESFKSRAFYSCALGGRQRSKRKSGIAQTLTHVHKTYMCT